MSFDGIFHTTSFVGGDLFHPQLILVDFDSTVCPVDIDTVDGYIQTDLSWLNEISDSLGMTGMKKIFKKNVGMFKTLYLCVFEDTVDVEDLVSEFESHNEVDWVCPNYTGFECSTPDDPLFTSNQNEYLNVIGMEEAWDYQTGSSNINVAIIDRGVDFYHEDIYGSEWVNSDETPNNSIDDDGNGYIDDVYGINTETFEGNISDIDGDGSVIGHGTWVRGIINAITDNSTGISGVAGGWFTTEGCKVLTVKLPNQEPLINYYLAGLEYISDILTAPNPEEVHVLYSGISFYGGIPLGSLDAIGNGDPQKGYNNGVTAGGGFGGSNYWLETGTDLMYGGNYSEAVWYFADILYNFESLDEAYYALAHLVKCLEYQELSDSALNCLNNYSAAVQNYELSDYCKYLCVDLLAKKGGAAIALSLCDTLLNSITASAEIKKDILLEKGFILKYDLKNYTQAEQIFTSFLVQYPQDENSFLAIGELGLTPAEVEGFINGAVAALIPDRFYLEQNYPNPFNPSTVISYSLPEISQVKLEIYNIMGQLVTTLYNGNKEPGHHNVAWKGVSSKGIPVASGIYIYRIQALGRESGKEYSMSRKMILIK